MVYHQASSSKPADNSLTAIRLSQSALRTLVIASAVLAILSLSLWIEGDLDQTLILAHNPLRDIPPAVACSNALSRFGMSVICLLVLSGIAATYRSPAFLHARHVLLVVLLSFSSATLASTVLKELLGRARPAVDLAGQLNAAVRHGSPSFPSGHAAQSLALALPFVLLVPGCSLTARLLKFAMLLVAALVGYSRIVKGAHYVSDVLAGASLALICLPLAIAAANALYTRQRVTPQTLDTMVKRQAFVILALALCLPFL